MSYIVAALYQFTPLPAFADHREALQACCDQAGTKGTLLLADEGINGTIAGTRAGIDAVLAHIRNIPGCADLVHKESWSDDMPFLRMKVRLKKEIVTLGAGKVDPLLKVGRYVKPEDWNDLISADDVAVIDTRNDYEVGIGTFEGAIDPQTKTFREFPQWWEDNKDRFHNKRIAMFCTGGIRCEKSTSYLLSLGVEEVYHLQGGILKYLEDIPAEQSRWDGECFVFDDRVSVGHGLVPGPYDMCHACRRPITEEDKQSAAFVRGVSCPHCIAERSDEDRRRFAERQKQIDLARERGEKHLGS